MSVMPWFPSQMRSGRVFAAIQAARPVLVVLLLIVGFSAVQIFLRTLQSPAAGTAVDAVATETASVRQVLRATPDFGSEPGRSEQTVEPTRSRAGRDAEMKASDLIADPVSAPDDNRQNLQTRHAADDRRARETAVPAPTGLLANKVLNITNSGDRIIVSNEYNQVVSVFEFSSGDAADAAVDAQDADPQSAEAPADYEELYPGCPRTLPQGAEEQMAAERLRYYGCRYRRSCAAPTDEAEGVCTWYLTGKVG